MSEPVEALPPDDAMLEAIAVRIRQIDTEQPRSTAPLEERP